MRAAAPLLLALAALAGCPHDFALRAAEAGLDAPGSGDRVALEAAAPADRRVTPDTVCPSPCVSTLAGRCGSAGDSDGSLRDANFLFPTGLAIENAQGDLLVADNGNGRIRRIAGGQVTTVAAGDPLAEPTGLSSDGAGGVAIADQTANTVLWMTSAGKVTTLAGTGVLGYVDGPAATARFRYPSAVSFAAPPGVLVADSMNMRIRRVAEGVVSTFAGSGVLGCDDGALLSASLEPVDLASGPDGALYVTDGACKGVRRIAGGQVTTVAGSSATTELRGIVVDAQGTIFVARGDIIWRIAGGKGWVYAGSQHPGYRDGAALSAQFRQPTGLAIEASGAILVADKGNHCIRMIR
jgi:hypothetical protein